MIPTMRGKAVRVVSVAALVFLAACESFLDVNQDPNNPEHARVDLRLAPLITGFGHAVYYGDTQMWGAEWMEYFAYCCDTRSYAEVEYYELQENDPSHAWGYYFTSILNEARLMMEDTDKDVDPAYYGLAEFISAWTWAHVTDMWGPVPYTEAFNTGIPNPAYDDQQTVYAGVFQSLDEAIALMPSPSTSAPGPNDLLFGGDMGRWVKLANVVKAKLQMRVAYAPGENTQAHAQAALDALSHGFTSNSDDADFVYPGGADARNPLYTFQELRDRFGASEYIVDLENDRADPRMPILFRPALYDSVHLGTIVYRGHAMGEPQDSLAAATADSTISDIGHYFSDEGASLNWESYADAKFIEAEARLIVSGAGAADAPYREGIRANMEKLGVASADIDTYLTGRPSLTAVANPLEEIMTEKYIANFLKVDAWNDYRRTGYPHPPLPQDRVLSDIPQRIRTPGSELSNNAENVGATNIDPGLDGMMTKVWWASGSPPASATGGH